MRLGRETNCLIPRVIGDVLTSNDNWKRTSLKTTVASFLGPVLRRPISANPGLIFTPRFFSFCAKAFRLATSQPHEFLSEQTELNFNLGGKAAKRATKSRQDKGLF